MSIYEQARKAPVEHSIKICWERSGEKRIVTYKSNGDYVALLYYAESIFLTRDESINEGYKGYYIDEEGDEIEIVDIDTFKMFLENDKTKKKIHFVEKNSTKSVKIDKVPEKIYIPTTEAGALPANQTVHPTVVCDNCNVAPIKGFRYKCVSCDDFDLCMACENKGAHSEHVMIRFPVPLPYSNVHLDRRFFKKMRHGCFGVSRNTSADTNRPRCGRRRHDFGYQNLFPIMDYFADAGESDEQNPSPNTEESARKQETSSTSARNSAKAENSFFPIDPNYAQAGVNVLKNFADMFGKMLDPLGIEVDIDIGLKDDKKCNKTESTEDEKLVEPKPNENKTEESATEIVTIEDVNDEKMDVEKEEENKEVTPIVVQDPKPSTSSQTDFAKTTPETETGWTLIDKSLNEQQQSGHTSPQNSPTPPQSSTSPQSSVDYSKLSRDLLSHIQSENNKQEQQPETRAQIVYHKDKKINDAVISMMAMGFSNEGNWLTNLLVTVGGDIQKALELLHPSR